MAKKLYVFSTLTAPQCYTNHTGGGNDLPIPLMVDGREGVLIHGGAGLIDANGIHTPRGVATEVTEAQVEYMRQNPIWQLHEKNGYVVVDSADAPDAEKAAADMASRDGSAPLVPEDLPDDEQPVVAGAPAAAQPANAKRVKRGG